MSERFGPCTSCNGTGEVPGLEGCLICGDTGFDGSIEALENQKPLPIPPLSKKEYQSNMERAIAIMKERLNRKNLS